MLSVLKFDPSPRIRNKAGLNALTATAWRSSSRMHMLLPFVCPSLLPRVLQGWRAVSSPQLAAALRLLR